MEMVRTETKGKTTTEWVSHPKGIEFVLEHESPPAGDGRAAGELPLNQEGVPAWLAEMRQSLETLTGGSTRKSRRMSRRLETWTGASTEALRRAQDGPVRSRRRGPGAAVVARAVGYLEHRRPAAWAKSCPLPELFAAAQGQGRARPSRTSIAACSRLHDRGLSGFCRSTERTVCPNPSTLFSVCDHYTFTRPAIR